MKASYRRLFHNAALLAFAMVTTIVIPSCATEGCTDATAENYDAKADSDDGNCIYSSDPFLGKWDFYDSVQAGPGSLNFVFDELRLLDIRVTAANRAQVLMFWKNEDGSLSDTITAGTKPYTIAIPKQDFGSNIQIEGNFILNPLDTLIETEYRLSYPDSTVRHRGIARFRD
jgi:hypothetical protein